MALAEARAVWQRAASRCFVQEDAKRAPKLACCSSSHCSYKEVELRPAGSAGDQEIPPVVNLPLDPEPLCRNISPNTRWWLHLKPGYGYQNGLIDAKQGVMEGHEETPLFIEKSCSEADFVIVDQLSVESSLSNQLCVSEEKSRMLCGGDRADSHKSDVEKNCIKEDLGFEALASNNVSHVDYEKSSLWWRTADAEELALLVAERSRSLMENCDLPLPQNARSNMDTSSNRTSFCHHEAVTPSINQTLVYPPSHLSSSDTGNTRSRNSYRKHGLHFESRQSRGEVAKRDENTAQLLEALRHSQTRARESEEIAKQVCAEKEHMVKLLLRQASHLFAYKQWFKLLQLENRKYLMALTDKSQLALAALPAMTRPMRRRKKMIADSQKPGERCGYFWDIGKYAVVLAVGVGLMLGWGLAWLMP